MKVAQEAVKTIHTKHRGRWELRNQLAIMSARKGANTSESIRQNNTDFGGIDTIPKSGSKNANSKHKKICEKFQAQCQPSLHHYCHQVCAVFHVQTMLCIRNGAFLIQFKINTE